MRIWMKRVIVLWLPAKVERYLSKEKPEYTPEAEVNILIWQKTDLGFKAIIDNKYSGLLYENEIFCPLETGMEMKAFVKQVREDGKVDLILQKPGFEKIDDFSKTLLDYIKAHGGRINLNDKSPAEDIYDTFGVSKKTFKKGVGDLYKKRLITLHEGWHCFGGFLNRIGISLHTNRENHWGREFPHPIFVLSD